MRIYRLLIVIAILTGLYYGATYIISSNQKKKLHQYERFASVVSEVSLAAELYRADQDSFFIARDSILKKYNMTIDSISAFRNKLADDKLEWQKVWELVHAKTDTIVDQEMSKYLTDTVDITDTVDMISDSI